MRIVSFTVRNYRSIVEAHKINLNDYSVLLGKNNEGKSNILRALSVCMDCINDYRRFRYSIHREFIRRDGYYNWNRDFPINLRNRKNGRKSIFELELYLDKEELDNFNATLHTRIKLHNILMKIEIGEDNIPNVTFPIRGTNSLTAKKEKVLLFLSDKITYNYIPAVRTENHALKLIKNNIAKELETLSSNKEYISSLEKIREIQKQCLDKISDNIENELKEFLPKVKNVEIEIEDDYKIATSLSDINVYVDDGILTNIENKGDGVKSLAVLAMLKNKQTSVGSSSIVAIDEPEAHLHPGAINELANTLKVLAKNNQVIISTHNHLFTNYLNLDSNIIVDNGKAKPVKNISDIRDILGVKASDNLINARFVLLVEGKSDERILSYIFEKKSPKIKKALSERLIMVNNVDGASKLEYNASKFRKEMCICIALVDNDDEGRKAYELVTETKDIDIANIFLCSCKGMSNSELEDCINPKIYKEKIFDEFGVNLDDQSFRNSKKWSIRIKDTFDSQGKLCNDKMLSKIKQIVVDCVIESSIEDVLIQEKSGVIDKLIERVDQLIDEC